MLRKKKISNFYACQICHMDYKEKEITQKCEVWCREHKGCNLDIIKYAVNKN